MADSTYRVGVFLDLAAGRYRRGAKAAAKDTARLGGTMHKAGRSGSLMGRRATEGARRARREIRRTSEETQRLGRALRVAGRDGERGIGRLARGAKTLRSEMALAARAAGRLRGLGGLLGVAGIAGGGFAAGGVLRHIIATEERLERLGIQSGRSTKDMQQLYEEIKRVASLPEIRLDPRQILAAVEAIVEKTGDLDFAHDNLELIAQAIQGAGSTGDALGRLAAELGKLGVTDTADVAEALNLITAQGKSGAFTLGNMAAQGERLFSAFARLDYRGAGAVRQLGAISQMARQSTGSSEQAATAVEALLRTLSDAQKIDQIWSDLGVNVRDATGAFRPLDRVLKEIVAATGGDVAQLSEIFDAEAIRAMSGLATPKGRADYERFLSIEAPADMLAQDAARIAATSGAKVQETKTDVEGWLQDNLTGHVGEVVTALTAFKDELLLGAGILAGSWYAFKGLRAAGRLFWRLAGRGAGGVGGLKPPAGGGSGPLNRGGLSGSEAGRAGPTGRPRNVWHGLDGSGPGTRPNNAWRRAVRTAAAAQAREAALISREEAARRTATLTRPGAVKSGPGTRPNNAWRRAVRTAAAAQAREAALISREEAARRTATLTRPGAVKSSPSSRPNNARPKPAMAYAGGLWRALSRGLGPASAGALMGLTAHDIHTGAIPDDQVAPEVGGLAGGLAGSSAAGRLAGKFTGRLPGPIGFFARLLSSVLGFYGGDSLGRVATDAVFEPGWTSEWSRDIAERWMRDSIPQHDPSAPLEIGNWRGVGHRLAEARRNRGRLDIGRNEVKLHIESVIGSLTVHSAASDPREVAEEVADEIERRMRDRTLGIDDSLIADPTPEASY